VPRIAITPCRKPADYVESVRLVGGDPVVLDLTAAVATEQLANADGLLLTGGGDVDPIHYNEPRHETFSAAEPGRDDAELSLAREAMARRLPILAICRGVQVLNVAAGGSLVQDIPSAITAAVDHRPAVPPAGPAHFVAITPGTHLAGLIASDLEDDAAVVNSRHHQSVGRVAPGFVVSAVAPDGVVEGIEAPDQPFCLGVQWHPENFVASGDFKALFRGLVDAAREFRERPLGVRRPKL
jgi:putative glutamine amidotransferase